MRTRFTHFSRGNRLVKEIRSSVAVEQIEPG